MRTTLFLGMTAVVLLGGCGMRKNHLTERYGASYDAAFGAQRERQDQAPALAIAGLDSQESAIVSDTYRASFAPKGAKVSEEPVILVAPGGNRGSTQRLAPSVPKE